MSTMQLLPIWLIQAGDMSGDIVSEAISHVWKDNIGIHVVWTGTPTGTLSVQLSNDPANLGWETITFSPTPDEPAGSAGSNFYDVMQTAAGYVRLIYTSVSGTGTLNAKIALKSV